MHRGFFRNKLPKVNIILVGENEEPVEVIVDSGFNGTITISEDIAKKINLEDTGGVEPGTTADGESSAYAIYRGKIIYEGIRVGDTIVQVKPGYKSLLGIAMLEQLDLNLFVDPKKELVELNQSGKRPSIFSGLGLPFN